MGRACTQEGTESQGGNDQAGSCKARTFRARLVCQPLQHRCGTVVPEQEHLSPNTGQPCPCSSLSRFFVRVRLSSAGFWTSSFFGETQK